MRARAMLTPEAGGAWDFRLVQAGRARLLLDGATVLDGFANPPPPGPEIFGSGSQPLTATVRLDAGRPVELVIEFANIGAGLISGVMVGWSPAPPDELIDRAAEAAARADVAVVVVGTGAEWESEGFDRVSMDLPGAQDELVERVLAANPHTVVVVNSGSPVTMAWADRVSAIVQIWFGGQEMAASLVDVLLGDAEPGGRLPTTFPDRLSTTRPTATSRLRTVACATARASSSATGGTRPTICPPGSPSATDCPIRPSASASHGLRRPRSVRASRSSSRCR